MEFVKTVLTAPFFWGAMLGLVFCALSVVAHFKTKGELKRLKGHLSDKLEIEAEKMSSMKDDIDSLKKENENLRVKIQTGRIEDSAQSLERELEIFARAEKVMILNAPGFAQAWETAKNTAATEIEEEEIGKSPVKRIFRKFFKGGSDSEEKKALPVKVEVSAGEKAALSEKSDNSTSEESV